MCRHCPLDSGWVDFWSSTHTISTSDVLCNFHFLGNLAVVLITRRWHLPLTPAAQASDLDRELPVKKLPVQALVSIPTVASLCVLYRLLLRVPSLP